MSMGSGGMDEYQRLIAERAAAQKRKRTIFGVVLAVALVAGGYWWKQQKDKKAGAQRILDAAGHFAEKDKTEMGAFWSCTFGSDIDIGMLSSAQQIQQKIEGAYFTQQKTFSDHLTNECVPKLERARGAMGALAGDMAPELKPSLDKYVAALPRMQTGLEVEFMTGVREKCGPLVQTVDKEGKPSPSKTFKANTKKLSEDPQRLLDALDYCAKRSRKGKKVLDLEDFLTAAGDYMEARGELVQTARETAAKIEGKPMPQPKAAGGAGPAPQE